MHHLAGHALEPLGADGAVDAEQLRDALGHPERGADLAFDLNPHGAQLQVHGRALFTLAGRAVEAADEPGHRAAQQYNHQG
jgi:hypothetical protein